jgi:hypothetical protein
MLTMKTQDTFKKQVMSTEMQFISSSLSGRIKNPENFVHLDSKNKAPELRGRSVRFTEIRTSKGSNITSLHLRRDT